MSDLFFVKWLILLKLLLVLVVDDFVLFHYNIVIIVEMNIFCIWASS